LGTCYDGMKVFHTLEDKETLEMTDEFGKQVYALTKRYDLTDFQYTKDNREEMFGHKLDVYMRSIGQTITEYLVNFEMLIDLMKEYGFRLETPALKGKHSGIFDHRDFTYRPGLGGFDQFLSQLASLASKDTRIKRSHAEALQMLEPENGGLRELSTLNNWFIFQKVE